MKKKSLLLQLALALFLLAGYRNHASAGHEVGSTITYVCIAPASYLVTLHIYRDCTGAAAAPNQLLNIAAPGCNTGRNITLNRVGSGQVGIFYCSAVGNGCSTSGRPNYETIRYESMVTFSAAEQACPDWILSATSTGNTRPTTENLVNGQGMYIEALLKLSGNLNNSSPQIPAFDVPAPIFCIGQPSQYVLNAVDPDCDSLSYELVAPLAAAGTPVTYKPIMGNTSGGTVMNPNPKPPYNTTFNPQYANVPAFGPNYSPQFPLVSYIIDWNNQPVVQGQAKVLLDQQNGKLRLMPAFYSTSGFTTNSYAVTVQIKEWRRVNGVMTNIGYIRRDLQFKVEDCGGNNLPALGPPYIPGNSFSLDTTGIITVRPGTQLNLRFDTTDPDINDILTVISDVPTVFPGAQLSFTWASRPVILLSFTAGTGSGCNAVKYFRMRIFDNACPIRGNQDYVIGIRVNANAAPLGREKEIPKPIGFSAYPNPFSGNVTFRVKQTQPQQQLLIYNVLGQQVDQIMVRGQLNSEQEITWLNAAKFPAGQYIVRFSGAFDQSLKISKLK